MIFLLPYFRQRNFKEKMFMYIYRIMQSIIIKRKINEKIRINIFFWTCQKCHCRVRCHYHCCGSHVQLEPVSADGILRFLSFPPGGVGTASEPILNQSGICKPFSASTPHRLYFRTSHRWHNFSYFFISRFQFSLYEL